MPRPLSAPNSIASATVKDGGSAKLWWTSSMPAARGADIADRHLRGRRSTSVPATGWTMPAATRAKVVLPAPFLADDGMDHLRREADRDVDQRLDVPVLDGDAPAFDRVGLGRHPRRGR